MAGNKESQYFWKQVSVLLTQILGLSNTALKYTLWKALKIDPWLSPLIPHCYFKKSCKKCGVMCIFILIYFLHSYWAFVTPVLNSALCLVCVHLYLHLFCKFSTLMLHYEQSFWGFLSSTFRKTTVLVPCDCSRNLSLILKALFICRYPPRIYSLLGKVTSFNVESGCHKGAQWQSQRSLKDSMASRYKMAQGRNMLVLHPWQLTSE